LCRAVARRRKVGVCGVTDLDDTSAGGGPARLGVAPEELEVDDGVGWGGFDELLEDGRPFVLLHAGHGFHTVKDFFLVDGVVPGFLLGSGDLRLLDVLATVIVRVLTSWFMIQTMTSSRERVRAYVEGLNTSLF
jgi:hypothetical protein